MWSLCSPGYARYSSLRRFLIVGLYLVGVGAGGFSVRHTSSQRSPPWLSLVRSAPPPFPPSGGGRLSSPAPHYGSALWSFDTFAYGIVSLSLRNICEGLLPLTLPPFGHRYSSRSLLLRLGAPPFLVFSFGAGRLRSVKHRGFLLVFCGLLYSAFGYSFFFLTLSSFFASLFFSSGFALGRPLPRAKRCGVCCVFCTYTHLFILCFGFFLVY